MSVHPFNQACSCEQQNGGELCSCRRGDCIPSSHPPAANAPLPSVERPALVSHCAITRLSLPVCSCMHVIVTRTVDGTTHLHFVRSIECIERRATSGMATSAVRCAVQPLPCVRPLVRLSVVAVRACALCVDSIRVSVCVSFLLFFLPPLFSLPSRLSVRLFDQRATLLFPFPFLSFLFFAFSFLGRSIRHPTRLNAATTPAQPTPNDDSIARTETEKREGGDSGSQHAESTSTSHMRSHEERS